MLTASHATRNPSNQVRPPFTLPVTRKGRDRATAAIGRVLEGKERAAAGTGILCVTFATLDEPSLRVVQTGGLFSGGK